MQKKETNMLLSPKSNKFTKILSTEMNRRRFIKASALGVLGAPAFFTGCNTPNGKSANTPGRVRRGKMYYRRLGRTGLMVSEISLGGSPVPPEPVFRKALEMGVNYVDTSSVYSNGNSERNIGKIIAGRRADVFVATKFHPGRKRKTKEALIQGVEKSLTRLKTDYIDILLIHGAQSPEVLSKNAVLAAFDKLKKDGKIRFTGVSCHADPLMVLTPAVTSGNYDVINVAYNAYSGPQIEKGKVYDDYLPRSGIEELLALAAKNDVGVVAMKSMAGGNMQNLSEFKAAGFSLPQAKLKWVLQNNAVGTVISEMLNFEILEENLSVTGMEMSSAERKILSQYIKATYGDYCRMCGTCLKNCPLEIAIPDILRYTMYHDGYGKTDSATASYRKLAGRKTFYGCSLCGKCEAVCPYGLQIIRKLERAQQLLS